jgi:hypothetical protein
MRTRHTRGSRTKADERFTFELARTWNLELLDLGLSWADYVREVRRCITGDTPFEKIPVPMLRTILETFLHNQEEKRFNCVDCWQPFPVYLVTNETWAAAGLHPHADCCLGCLQNRLKRSLTIDDFPPCPVNAYALTGKLAVMLEEERRFQERHKESRRGLPG